MGKPLWAPGFAPKVLHTAILTVRKRQPPVCKEDNAFAQQLLKSARLMVDEKCGLGVRKYSGKEERKRIEFFDLRTERYPMSAPGKARAKKREIKRKHKRRTKAAKLKAAYESARGESERKLIAEKLWKIAPGVALGKSGKS